MNRMFATILILLSVIGAMANHSDPNDHDFNKRKVDCRIFVYAPSCRGAGAKRDVSLQDPYETKIIQDFNESTKNILMRRVYQVLEEVLNNYYITLSRLESSNLKQPEVYTLPIVQDYNAEHSKDKFIDGFRKGNAYRNLEYL